MAKYTLKYTGEQIDSLLDKINNDVTQLPGSINYFSDTNEKEGYLLCNGNIIFASNYPSLRNKLKGYDVLQYLTVEELGISNIYNMYHLNGYYIIISSSSSLPSLLYSTDGYTWNTVTIPERFTSIDYDNGKYFAIGDEYAYVYMSTDLITWTKKAKTGSENAVGEYILYKKGIVVVGIDYGYIKYSTDDGNTFIDVSQNSHSSNFSCDGLYYTGNKFIGYIYNGGSGGTKYHLYNSDDGINWTKVLGSNDVSYKGSRGTVYNGYIYYLSNNQIVRTLDGLEEEVVADISALVGPYSKITFNKDQMYLFGSATTIAYSNNMVDWHQLTLEGTYGTSALFFDEEKFINRHGNEPLRVYYLDGREKKLILPTFTDDTNQIYGHIKY